VSGGDGFNFFSAEDLQLPSPTSGSAIPSRLTSNSRKPSRDELLSLARSAARPPKVGHWGGTIDPSTYGLLTVTSFYTGMHCKGQKWAVEILGHKLDRRRCLLAAFEWNRVDEIQAF
jgi:hypothetical protein